MFILQNFAENNKIKREKTEAKRGEFVCCAEMTSAWHANKILY